MKKLFLIPVLAFLFASCEKEDDPVKLPPPGSLLTMEADMGSFYDDQVYVDLETGARLKVPYKIYDLAFEASPNGFRVYLNTGKFMFVANSGSVDMSAADSTG